MRIVEVMVNAATNPTNQKPALDNLADKNAEGGGQKQQE